MAKPSKSKTPKSCSPSAYKPHDLAKINPLKQQFEPTPACPVPQHYKMAGGA